MTRPSFFSLYQQGFARVASCCNTVHLADPKVNAKEIAAIARQVAQEHAALALFPELSITGYSIGDLLTSQTLLDETCDALTFLASETQSLPTIVIVGAPILYKQQLFNCAVVLYQGAIKGIIPKSFLPNYDEFYESRYFTSGHNITNCTIEHDESDIPFGCDLLFSVDGIKDFSFAVEICEDLWAPIPPSSVSALNGATILANLSASPATIGKSQKRRELCKQQSAKCHSAYMFAACGGGESTTDLCWDGEISICEDGQILAQQHRFASSSHFVTADIDLQAIKQARLRHLTFRQQASQPQYRHYRDIQLTLHPCHQDIGYRRHVTRYPFTAQTHITSKALSEQICAIQCASLRQRMEKCHAKSMILGISGGLDSAQALLVAVKTAQMMGLSKESVKAYMLTGFATSLTSQEHASQLIEAIGCHYEEIDIRPLCRKLLEAIGHPYREENPVYDVTFENVQAGARTDILFRLANQQNGIVIGTGDMSELALGWCTYGVGDHMSHYNVNCGLPKTIIQELFNWYQRDNTFSPQLRACCRAIREATISPELIPAQADTPQDTQMSIGPYELQDFTLYYFLKYGFSPCRLAFLAYQAWGIQHHKDQKIYSLAEIKKWLAVFFERFLGKSQFKRSAMPNGPKIFSDVALSPRGDLRLPSDGNARIWLAELEKYVPDS